MNRRSIVLAAAASAVSAPLAAAPEARPAAAGPHANAHDKALAGRFEKREADWRNGAIVYQVLVDRFAPSANLEAKRALYAAPRTVNAWDKPPVRGRYLEREQVWSHEIDFWGGDIASTISRLDHVQQLGANVLYLNPIHAGWTNHKYDSLDFQSVSPEFGTREDVKRLAAELKRRQMKLVLDGVFNHMGRNAPKFQAAQADPTSPFRKWFVFDPKYEGGARFWWDAKNLPELNLEHRPVREHLWLGRDSVVRSYLRDGADGWRLDVAYDIGFRYLEELTKAAHAEKPGSLVVGEIPNYPKEWFPSLDGVMQISLHALILDVARGKLGGADFMRMLTRLVSEANYEHLLKSWVLLDNHDSPRLATALPDVKARRLAQVLQFTLPGSVNLYYGSEVAMEGGEDPAMRAPMRWDLVAAGHPELAWTRQLTALRRDHRALRVGDWRSAEATGGVIAFERYTDHVGESLIVVVNPQMQAVDTLVQLPNSKLMDGENLIDQLSGQALWCQFAQLRAKLPAQTAWVLKPQLVRPNGYSNFKRVQ
jgi:glycosidase